MKISFKNPPVRGTNIPKEILDSTFSVEDVVKGTGHSRQTVYNWIKKGALKADRYGRQLRISKDQFNVDAGAPDPEKKTRNRKAKAEKPAATPAPAKKAKRSKKTAKAKANG